MISTISYQTYQLLYCKGHIQITSNYSTIDVDGEEIKCKNETLNSIYL